MNGRSTYVQWGDGVTKTLVRIGSTDESQIIPSLFTCMYLTNIPPVRRAFGVVNRVFNTESTTQQRAEILMARELGEDRTTLAAQFKTTNATIAYTEKRWDERQHLASFPRPGRPSAVSPRDLRHLKRTVRREPRIGQKVLRNTLPHQVMIKFTLTKAQSFPPIPDFLLTQKP